MRKLLFFILCLLSISLSAQYSNYATRVKQEYPNYTMEQLEVLARAMEIEKVKNQVLFLKYISESSEYIKAGKWEYALEYIKRAEQTNLRSEILYYNKGIIYFNLNKKGRLKKVIKEAKKRLYFEIADSLTVKLNGL
jgi:tetratricopeptide (TPR) repeat protein